MHADSATESGKCSHHTFPLNSYYGGKQGKRGVYKLFIWQKVSLKGHLVHTLASESSNVTCWWPVCLVKYSITVKSHVISCQVNGWAWWWGELLWQCDVIFRRHCGITSQSDGGWPALFTSLSLLTGPGNDMKWHSLILYHRLPVSKLWIHHRQWIIVISNCLRVIEYDIWQARCWGEQPGGRRDASLHRVSGHTFRITACYILLLSDKWDAHSVNNSSQPLL